MTSPSHTQLRKTLGERLELPDNAVLAARDAWTAERELFMTGASDDPDLARKYAAVFTLPQRFSYEARNLYTHHANDDSKTIIYAIDPHILNSYAEFQKTNSVDNLDFIQDEWTDDDDDAQKQNLSIKQQYMLYLTRSIVQSDRICILPSGRTQLLENFTFFANETRKAELGKNKQYLHDRVTRYEKVFNAFNTASAKANDENHQAQFQRLIAAFSSGSIYSDLAMSRLAEILSAGDFGNVKHVVQAALQGESPERRKDFFKLLDRMDDVRGQGTEENGALNTARRTFDFAYSIYSELTKYTKTDTKRLNKLIAGETDLNQQDRTPPQSQYLNRSAVFEIHKINCAFEHLKLNYEIQYITNSTYLFNFVRNLDRNLKCQLVHSRTYFAYRDKDFYKSISKLSAGPIAFNSGALSLIVSDKKVTGKELNQLKKFKKHLKPFRNADAFSAATRGVPETFLNALNQSLEKLAEAIERNDGLSEEDARSLTKRVKNMVETTKDQLDRYLTTGVVKDRDDVISSIKRSTVSATSDQMYEIFNQLSKGNDDKPRIAVRMVLDSQNRPKRLICLPISGSFRYTFSISNTDVLNQKVLTEKGIDGTFKILTIYSLVTAIETSIEHAKIAGEVHSENKSQAVKSLVRAIHAASYRDWSLTLFFCDDALNHLDKVTDVNKSTGRYYFLSGEVHYLKHLAQRGLAEIKSRGKAQIKRLVASRGSLQQAAKAMESAYINTLNDQDDQQDPHPYEFDGALTYRLALAACGLSLELLVAQRNFGMDFTASDLGLDTDPILPVASPKIQTPFWQVKNFQELNFDFLWSDPRQFSIKLQGVITSLYDQAKQRTNDAKDAERNEPRTSGTLSSVNGADKSDPILWNYRKMRTMSMIAALSEFVRNDLIFGSPEIPNRKDFLAKFDECNVDFNVFIRKLKSAGPKEFTPVPMSDFVGIAAPFARLLFLAITSQDENMSALETATICEEIKKQERRLDPIGLPRELARRIVQDLSERKFDGLKMWEAIEKYKQKSRKDFYL